MEQRRLVGKRRRQYILEDAMETKSMFVYRSPLGRILITQEGPAITELQFVGDALPGNTGETPLLKAAAVQLEEYFKGKRRHFELPLAPRGTAFQQRVWEALQEIPYGRTRSYGEIAREVGNEKAARAVGMANNRNPIAIVIPCHRVIGADGKLVGYGGGLDKKAYLLDLEKRHESVSQGDGDSGS